MCSSVFGQATAFDSLTWACKRAIKHYQRDSGDIYLNWALQHFEYAEQNTAQKLLLAEACRRLNRIAKQAEVLQSITTIENKQQQVAFQAAQSLLAIHTHQKQAFDKDIAALLPNIQWADSSSRKQSLRLLNSIHQTLQNRKPPWALPFDSLLVNTPQAQVYLPVQFTIYNWLSTDLYNASQYDQAMQAAFYGLSLANKPRQKAVFYSRIGNIYEALQEGEQAKAYFLQSFKIYQVQGDTFSQIRALNNIGTAYRNLELYDSALAYFQKGLELVPPKHGYRIALLCNLGELSNISGQHSLALHYLKEAKTLLHSLVGDRPDMGRCIINQNIAVSLGAQAQYVEAIQLLHTTLAESKALQAPKIEMALLGELATSYARVGQFEQAYQTQVRFEALKDSLFNETKNKTITELETKYQTEKKEQEIALLKEQEAKQQAQIRQQRILNYSLLGGALLLSALAFTFFRGRQKQKQANALIAEYNMEVEAKNQALAISEQALKQSNQSKERLFSIIAHDLNAPLDTFQGAVNLIRILGEEGLPKEELIKQLYNLEGEFNTVSALMQNLLYWAMSQQDAIQYLPKPTAIKPCVQEVCNLLCPTAKNRSIELEVIVPDLPTIATDLNMLQLILRNLLSNAIKFSPDGGKVQVKVELQEGLLGFEIRDEGLGIPPEKLERLLSDEQSLGVRTNDATGQKGTGLGLMVSKEFAQQLGGQLSAQSELGQGSVFKLALPVQIHEEKLL
ncbi:MAG: tetratricopeptide repeat-containing sensor histidine kinase [Flammeovirgaceae bacterium]